MTGKVINLRQARKAKARDAKRVSADTNAVRHGLPKSLHDATAVEKSKAKRLLDGHQMKDGESDTE